MNNEVKKKFALSFYFPILFIFGMWLVKIIEWLFNFDFGTYGIFPLHKSGLIGIITAPFIHKDFFHLISNSLPLFVLGFCIFYFYSEIAFRLFFLIYFTTNFWVWIFAREAYHIGASGLVYGFASYLFFSGIIRGNLKLLAISLMVVFLYGGMIWGVLPINYHVSWESHLMGAIAGLTFAIFFKKYGPQKEVHHWDDDEDENEPVNFSESKTSNSESTTNNNEIKINYQYTSKDNPIN